MASVEGSSYRYDGGLLGYRTMTTQGLGDIVFESSVGRMFAVLVMLNWHYPLFS